MSQKLIRWHSFLNVFIFGVAFIFVKIYILSVYYLYQHFHCKTCKVYFLQIEMRYYVLVVLFNFSLRESSIFYAQSIYVFLYTLLLLPRISGKYWPEYFMENGYHTAKSGKVFHSSKKGAWHDEGVKTDYGPIAFDGLKAAQHPSCPESMFQLGALDATFTSLDDIPKVKANDQAPGYNGWYLTKLKKGFKYINDNDRDLMSDEASVEWFKSKIQKLETSEHRDPFFISLGFHRPHTPLVVPQKYFDLFPLKTVKIPKINFNDTEDTKLGENSIKESRGRKAYRWLTESYSSVELALKKYTQAYLASVAFADDMVGKALETLEKSSFKENLKNNVGPRV